MSSTTIKYFKSGKPVWLSQLSKCDSLLVNQGSLWLTSSRTGQEQVITPGQAFAWDGDEDWLIEALGEEAAVELAYLDCA